MIKAVLMDLDGVLVNAVVLHYVALNKSLKKICSFELTYDEHFKELNGLPTKRKLEQLTAQGRVQLSDHQKIFDLKQYHTTETINETINLDYTKIELHKYIKSLELKSACITNSIRDTAYLMLQRSGQLEHLDFVISNEDIRYAKPNSEGYITAMVRLGVYPNECIVIEDSDHGYESAKNTGSFVFRVSGPEEVNLENFKKFKEGIKC